MNYPGNYTKSEILEVPRFLKTRPNAPRTKLAYITPEEEGILAALKPGTPHKGPENIPNYDTWAWSGDKKDPVTGGSTAGWANDRPEVPKPQSYQQKEQMASPRDKEAFRERTGSQVITPSERIARTKNWVTGKDKFLDKPIFVTQDLSYDELSDIAAYGEKLKAEEQARLEAGIKAGKSPEDIGWQSEEWSDWFDQLSGLTSITGDDWADTSKGWYFEGEVDEFGNPVVPGPTTFSGINYSGGYGDDIAAYYGAGLQQGPKQLGDEEFVPGQTPLQEYMVSVNKYNPYTKLAMAKDGGLLSLVR
jgi:hypothetical protein